MNVWRGHGAGGRIAVVVDEHKDSKDLKLRVYACVLKLRVYACVRACVHVHVWWLLLLLAAAAAAATVVNHNNDFI